MILIRTKDCMVCGKHSQVTVEEEKWRRWRGGELIQNVWPEWTADQRELLISGTHSECWEKIFGAKKGYEDA